MEMMHYRDGEGNSIQENCSIGRQCTQREIRQGEHSSFFLPNPNVLVADSKRMYTIEFCCNRICQFFSWGAE